MYDFASDPRPKIAIKDLVIPPGRARDNFSHVIDLADSIRSMGHLEPIVLNKRPDGKYVLMCGESRVKATLLIPEACGMIPFTWFENLSTLKQKEAELEENLRRKNLEPLEQCKAIEDIDTIKREIYGSTIQGATSTDDKAWNIRKTADFAQISVSQAQFQIALSKKLTARPDLKEKVKNLPLSAMAKVIAQTEESERVQRLHSTGQIEISSDLRNTDALTLIKSLADSSVDLFLFDPPFGLESLEDRKDDTFVAGSSSYIGQMAPDDNSTPDKVISLMSSLIPEMSRTLKPGSHFYIFFDLALLGRIQPLLVENKLTLQLPVLLWDKVKTTTPFRGYSYSSCYEAILFGFKPAIAPLTPRRLTKAAKAILPFSAVHSSNKTHIFEKPLELLSFLITQSTNYGDLVCDPFAGSGSTLDAAKQCGRRALGSEINPEHFFRAQGRLLQSLSTTKKGA